MSKIVIPPPGERSSFVRMGITAPKDLIIELKIACAHLGIDISTFVRNAILKELENKEV